MWLLASLLLIPLQDAPKEDPAAGIVWSKPDGAELFKSAHDAYLAKEYREAVKLFKKARKKTRDKASRAKVEVWERTAQGAFDLADFRSMAARKKKRGDALRRAEARVERYRGTLIYAAFNEFIADLRSQLFFTLEDFEKGSGPYDAKRGKRFVHKDQESEWVKEGNYSIEWKVNSSPAELKVKNLPKNLTEFRSVAFWMHFPRDKSFSYKLVFMGRGKSSVENGSGQRTRNGFSRRMKGHKGWRRVEMPLKSFQSYGSITWAKIQDFRITFEGRKGLTVYVDDIHLIRK